MLDPTGSMTTLAPISESPLTPTHQHLHGSYHSMNHMMSHHHPGTLSGHTAGKYQFNQQQPHPNHCADYQAFNAGHHGHSAVHHPVITAAVAAAGLHPDTDTDPRELEAFAERFKQRRIKLGKPKDKNTWQSVVNICIWEIEMCLSVENRSKLSRSFNFIYLAHFAEFRIGIISLWLCCSF